MQKWAEWFYKSGEWQRVRENAYQRDCGLCQDCLDKGIVTPAVDVHHIVWLTRENIKDPNISTNLDNLISLCKDCHAKRHKKKKRWKVDELGRVTMDE